MKKAMPSKSDKISMPKKDMKSDKVMGKSMKKDTEDKMVQKMVDEKRSSMKRNC